MSHSHTVAIPLAIAIATTLVTIGVVQFLLRPVHSQTERNNTATQPVLSVKVWQSLAREPALWLSPAADPVPRFTGD